MVQRGDTAMNFSLKDHHDTMFGLCDFRPHGTVAMKYGIFRDENGFSKRANIIVDEKQRVVFVQICPVHPVPDIKEIIGFLGKCEEDLL